MHRLINIRFFVMVKINIVLLGITSCSTDVDYNPPAISHSLVAYSILKADSSLSVIVTRTQDINDMEIACVSNATVKIYDESGILLDSALYAGNGKYLSRYKVVANRKVTVRVEAPGFNAVQASDYAPSGVEIKEAYFREKYEYDAINDYMYGLVTVTFQDNPAERNYYEMVIAINQGDGTFGRVTPFIVSNEFVNVNSREQNNPQSILFNDALFNGKEVVLRIKAQTSMSPYVIFRNTSETYYRYQNSLYSHLFTKPEKNDRFFTAEPVSIYTNIENGFGIVAGYNQCEYQSINVEINEDGE